MSPSDGRVPARSADEFRGVPRFDDGENVSKIVVALAVRFLPAAHRWRYREEFLAELVEHRWWPGRISYALRLTACMWSLRSSLGTPRPRGARTG
jgi:hypothetical protein